MDDICEKIREQLPELIDAGLSPEKAVELEQHRSQCPECNEYFEALAADDRLLCEFARAMRPSLTRLENIAIDELGRRRSGRTTQTVSIGAKVLSSRAAGIAAAVLVVAAILIGAAMFGDSGENPAEIVVQPDESGMVAPEPKREVELDLQAVTEAELQEIRRMIAASDVVGVIAMLNDGQPQSKIAAANYLATTGDTQAIGALEQLAAEWQGDASDNPYAAAIAQIMSRLQQQKQESKTGEDEADEAIAETATVGAEDEIGCKGVVVDEQGRAIGDARVLLYHNRSRWGLGNRVLEETTSTADGSFVCRQGIEFSTVKEHSYARDTYVLMAAHPDYAFGWWNITQTSKKAACRIVLTSPTWRIITVTDDEGNPLPGAWVWPYSAGDRESANAVYREYLHLPTDVGLVGAVTDADGQAIVTNLPGTGCSFHATLKGYAEGLAFPGQTTIHLSKGASVSGWVLAEEKEPVAGAIVRFTTNWMNNYFLAVTDNEGYFHLEDLPAKGWDQSPWGNSEGANGSYTVTVEHKNSAAQQVNVTLLPGQSIDDLTIQAYNGTTLVECLVLESGTNVPVSGARISGSNKIGRINGYSDPNGIFSVRVLPGRVSLSFLSPPDGVYVLEDGSSSESRINFSAIGDKMAVTLRTPPIAGFLRSVSGIVLGPDGMPLGEAETVVYAGAGEFHTSTAGSYVRPAGVDGDGHFELKEVPAGRKLHLYVTTKDGTLAATDVFTIPDDPDWSDYLTINLAATQGASVVVSDEDGHIIPEREFSIAPLVEGQRIWPADRKARTDENGLLEIDGIVPGLEYYLSSVEPEASRRTSAEAASRRLTLKMVLAPL